MATFAMIALRLVEDTLWRLLLLFRSTRSLEAENLFLRRQLALRVLYVFVVTLHVAWRM